MKVLVIGANGDLGRRIVAHLRDRAIDVVPFARPEGDLRDRDSLAAAMRGVTGVFVQSSPARDQVELETNAIEAAEAAGVARVVKLSNIPIPGLDHGLHGNHRAIEQRLAKSTVRSVVVQPSFFTTVVDKQRKLIARGKLVMPTGRGRIAWIDPADIAEVSAAALTRDDLEGPLHITGPEALDADEVATRLGVQRLDPPLDAWRDAAIADGLDPWLAASTVDLYEAVARGALATVTDTVERVLGRSARRVFQTR